MSKISDICCFCPPSLQNFSLQTGEDKQGESMVKIDLSFRLHGDGVIVATGLLAGEGEVAGLELVPVGEGRPHSVRRGPRSVHGARCWPFLGQRLWQARRPALSPVPLPGPPLCRPLSCACPPAVTAEHWLCSPRLCWAPRRVEEAGSAGVLSP